MHGTRTDFFAPVVAAGAVEQGEGIPRRGGHRQNMVRGIEVGSRLAGLLRLLYPGDELHSVDNEDILDVSIAISGGCICPHSAASDVGGELLFFRSCIPRGRSI